MKPFIEPLILLMGLVFLVVSCFLPSSKIRKEVEGGVWRRTDYPGWGFFAVLLYTGVFGSQLAGAFAGEGSSFMLVMGYALIAAAYGVYFGRTIERGVQDGRPGPVASTQASEARGDGQT